MNDTFYKSYWQIIHGIELCLENKLQLPTLNLIYSSIDSLSWIAYGDIEVKTRFTKYIECYMYKEKKLKPSPIDLYAARCAILHTLTSESNISNKGKALQIPYAWGNASVNDLEKSITLSNNNKLIALHINDLFESFKQGLLLFLESNKNNEECITRINKHFATLSINTIKNYNNLMV